MKITRIGTDYISIDEYNYDDENLLSIPRVHLIKLNFDSPTETKIKKVIYLYPKTNRFVIDNNVRIYNSILRITNKKYYISNTRNDNIITFFRKNNKVLVDFFRLSTDQRRFLLSNDMFEDVLRNTEVICIDNSVFRSKRGVLNNWSGNIIIK